MTGLRDTGNSPQTTRPGQLALPTTPPPAKKASSQLTRLPGTTWQHIFQAVDRG